MDKSLPIDIQLFAEPAAPEESAAGNAPEIDYEKLAGIINGAQAAKEDAVLKNYFKQQGLSAEEASQAITSFKEMKAKNQPDLTALQDQATQAQAAAQQAMLERDATLAAGKRRKRTGQNFRHVKKIIKGTGEFIYGSFKLCNTVFRPDSRHVRA